MVIIIDVRDMFEASLEQTITLDDYLASVSRCISNSGIPAAVKYRGRPGDSHRSIRFDLGLIPNRSEVKSVTLSRRGYMLIMQLEKFEKSGLTL